MSDGLRANPRDGLSRYFADREMSPLQGTLMLYQLVFAEIQERWLQDSISVLQRDAGGIVSEAVLFTIWTRLRAAKSERQNIEKTGAYIIQMCDALRALIKKQYRNEDLAIVRELGEPASRVADRYDTLLKQFS